MASESWAGFSSVQRRKSSYGGDACNPGPVVGEQPEDERSNTLFECDRMRALYPIELLGVHFTLLTGC